MALVEETPAARGEEICEKFLLTLDMFESGLTLMRDRLRREAPELSAEAIEERLIAWLSDRPPDGPGG